MEEWKGKEFSEKEGVSKVNVLTEKGGWFVRVVGVRYSLSFLPLSILLFTRYSSFISFLCLCGRLLR